MKKLGLILGLLNTVAIATVLGLFVYTKMVFKRPEITEEKERAKIVAAEAKPQAEAKHVMIPVDPITVNLDPFVGADGKQKIHYATLALTFEMRSQADATAFNQVVPVIMDKVIQNLGKKKFEDLNQVQGRYLFRSQIIEATNEYLTKPSVSDVFFADFLLQ